jgi:hypothetical protein
MFALKEQEPHFNDLLNESISKLDKKGKYLRWSYYMLSLTILALSAALTIILGYNSGDAVRSKNIALILGSIITLLSSVSTFWKLESYWVRRKILLQRLRDLQADFNYQKLLPEAKDLDDLFEKYKALQNYQTIYWESVYDQVTSPNNRNTPAQSAKNKDQSRT